MNFLTLIRQSLCTASREAFECDVRLAVVATYQGDYLDLDAHVSNAIRFIARHEDLRRSAERLAKAALQ
jgi:hypothetical protein